MQTDLGEEWRRLAEHYRSMSDEELRELARDFVDLTETAQRALRQEFQSRGLGEPGTPETYSPTSTPNGLAAVRMELERDLETHVGPPGSFGHIPQLVPDAPDDADEEGEHEYTWKTVLCDCETTEQAWQLSAALKKAGVDSWVQDSREFGLRYARVLVAADQLDRAREIAERPVPQEIIDDSKVEVPEYETPKCPKCGAEDPILDAVEPTNHWRCEQCDAEWSDAAGGEDAQAASADLSGA